ncbi:hypothetical protein T484DRAFT_1839784 [Baffinella frigidus]|nr:hypothetical protein T484DRAFT_1839784 [Cryptophyta sp. CCMP2293]
MSKTGESFSFFPRRKEGEDPEGPLTRHLSVNYGDLEALFHLPLKDAAREMGLCPTTFKKACRSFKMEHWPFRKGQGRTLLKQEDALTDVFDVKTPPEVHQDTRGVTVSCTNPSAFGFTFPSNTASRSTAAAVLSIAAPLQQESMAFDTRSCGEARHAGPAFDHTPFALDAPSCIDSSARGRVFVGVPLPQGTWTGACGATPPEDGPCVREDRPRGLSVCVEAVMEYLAQERAISAADVASILSD